MSSFGGCFRDGQYTVRFGQFFVCCFSTHGAPRVQPFVKLGARVPRAPWSRLHSLYRLAPGLQYLSIFAPSKAGDRTARTGQRETAFCFLDSRSHVLHSEAICIHTHTHTHTQC